MRVIVRLDNPTVRFLLPLVRYYLPLGLATLLLYLGLTAREPTVWLMAVPVAVLTAFAADNIIGDQVRDTFPTWRRRWRFWLLPATVMVATLLFLHVIVDPGLHVFGIVGGLVLLGVALWAEGAAAHSDEPNVTVPSLVLSLVAYAVTFLLFSAVFDAPVGAFGQAALTGACAFVLSIELYRQGHADLVTSLPQALVAGLLTAQLSLALDYWPLTGMLGGIFLLLVFYGVTGIGQSYFAGRLTRNTVIEFVAVMALGFLLLFAARTWIF